MTTEYGKQITCALKAVAQMHSDTSRLLIDCDKHIGKGRPSVFGSYATRDLTYNYKADFWMAEGVYRYYPAGVNAVDGVTVAFIYSGSPTDPRSDTEPLFLVGHVQYSEQSGGGSSAPGTTKGRCEEWDLWRLYFEWSSRELGSVLQFGALDDGRIASARVIAVPLFSIDSIEQVLETANRVLLDGTVPNRAVPVTE
jgi:hypothetical protein